MKQTQNVWPWRGLWVDPKGKSENWICTEYLDKTRELLLVSNESESGSAAAAAAAKSVASVVSESVRPQ